MVCWLSVSEKRVVATELVVCSLSVSEKRGVATDS